MDEIDWTFISTILSVGIGWALNEISQRLKGKKEDRRIRNKVLFYLLQLYSTLKLLDTGSFLDTVSKKIAARFPKEEQTEELQKSLANLYHQLIGILKEKETAQKISSLEGEYRMALSELSSVDPIESYRLFGDTEFFKMLDGFSAYAKSLKSEYSTDEENVDKVTTKILEFIKPELLTSTLGRLEERIKGYLEA